jgi:hypothetical protein
MDSMSIRGMLTSGIMQKAAPSRFDATLWRVDCEEEHKCRALTPQRTIASAN